MKAFADELTELIMKDIDKQPTVDAIPVEWIQRQRDMYPGMESAMWENGICDVGEAPDTLGERKDQ